MINMVITTAGRQAIINATRTGTNAVTIEKIAVGTGKYTPVATQTGLQVEVTRLNIVEGGSTGDNAIHVVFRDESADSYAVYEFGLFLNDGTLFAVYSSSNAILQKTAASVAYLAVDIMLEDIDVSNISFGDLTFANGGATTTNAGVVAIATDAEVLAGTNGQKALTPSNIKALTATESRAGLIAISTDAETKAGANDTKSVTPLKLKSTIDARLATTAEVQAGTDANKLVTPATLVGRTATESRVGMVEVATNTETTTGTDTARATTPAGVMAAINSKVKSASESVTGIVALATTTEASTGTNTTKAVTPAGVAAAITAKVVNSSTSVRGVVELATTTETSTGTDSTRAVTPAGVKAALDDRMQAVTIDGNSRIINSSGNGNASFYPSGQNSYYQTRAGANQMGLARFSDNEDGNSLVMFKSRGATIHTSKRVNGGDKIGQINFLADTGNLDFSESTIGARAALIEGGVFETPSNSANIGVRGYIRLFACSDGASRDGRGVEILDNTLRPTDHDTINLGTDARRFKNLYLTAGVVETSDIRAKRDIVPITEAEEKLAIDIAKMFCSYRVKKDVKENGETAQRYFGVIAQDVLNKFEAAGIDAGAIIKEGDENTAYGVRYRDLFAFVLGGLSAKIEQLENRIVELESRGVNNG